MSIYKKVDPIDPIEPELHHTPEAAEAGKEAVTRSKRIFEKEAVKEALRKGELKYTPENKPIVEEIIRETLQELSDSTSGRTGETPALLVEGRKAISKALQQHDSELSREERIGFPDAPLNGATDMCIDIGEKDGKVILGFNDLVTWVGMSPVDAIEIGVLLIKQAIEIEGKLEMTAERYIELQKYTAELDEPIEKFLEMAPKGVNNG